MSLRPLKSLFGLLKLVDVTCPSVAARASLPAACHMPLATAIAATAMKHARYGDVHPHMVLPFVVTVEHAGGINSIRAFGTQSADAPGIKAP